MAFASAQVILINFWHATYSYVSLPFTVLLSLAQWLLVLIPLLYVLRRPGSSWMLLFPAVIVLFDWLRGLGFLAYPWGMLGTTVYPWIPYIQLASVTGVWGLTFLLTAANAALAESILKPLRPRLSLSILLGALLLPLLFGMLDLATAPGTTGGPRLLLVQHNRDPRKHDYADSVEALISLSREGIARAEAEGRPVDLVVWPETAFVPDIRYWMRDANAGRPRRRLAETMFVAVEEWDIPLLTGTSDHTRLPEEGDTDYPEISYNSTMLISPENAREGVPGKTYHKIVLVPFTEYFPFKEELPQIYAQLDKFDVSDWTPGREYVVFDHPKFSFATPICFEDIMPGHVRAFVAAGAEGIVNVSNDYWSLSPVEGMQHGVNALFRAVENRVPLVRATTSGLTMGVDPYGRILGSLPFFEEGALIVDLPAAPEGRSLYTRFGDWFPLLLLGLLSLESVLRLHRTFRKR
jgi:apolipoprotein N-acyltransferase